MKAAELRALQAAAMSEEELQAQITDRLNRLKLLWFHDVDPLKNRRGYPDLTIAGPGGTLFRELKTMTGRVSAAQQKWLDTLSEGGEDAKVWRPIDLLNGTVDAELAVIARRAVA